MHQSWFWFRLGFYPSKKACRSDIRMLLQHDSFVSHCLPWGVARGTEPDGMLLAPRIYKGYLSSKQKETLQAKYKKNGRGGRIDSRNKQQTGRLKRRSETLLKDGETKNAMMNDTMEKEAQRRRRRWQYRLEILREKEGNMKRNCQKWHLKSSQQDGKN